MKVLNKIDIPIKYINQHRYDILARPLSILMSGLDTSRRRHYSFLCYRQNGRLNIEVCDD